MRGTFLTKNVSYIYILIFHSCFSALGATLSKTIEGLNIVLQAWRALLTKQSAAVPAAKNVFPGKSYLQNCTEKLQCNFLLKRS